MIWQRTIGIDLALKGSHTATVCDTGCGLLNTKPLKFTTDLQELKRVIAQHIPEGIDRERVAVVMEPTSNAWVIISAFFISRGHRVFVVKTQKAHDLRKYFKRYAKTDGIDSRTLAKMPFVDSDGLNQLVLSDKDYFSLAKQVKLRENMVNDISAYKNRIYAYFQLLNPKLMSLFGNERFTFMARAFYRKYANPFKVKKDGFAKFNKYLNKKAFGTPNQGLIKEMFDTSVNISDFHQDIASRSENKELPYDMDQLQEILKDNLDIIEFLEKKQRKIEEDIKRFYNRIDPGKILKDIKGFGGNIIAPAIIALTGSIKRFCKAKDYLGYIGLVPKTKQSVKPAKEGLRITKAGQKLLKKYYCMAAEVSRRFDVEFANKYNLLISRGLHHNQAICALGNMLARRVYSLLKQKQDALEKNDELRLRNIHYEFRDLNHKRITAFEAFQICRRDYPSKREQAERLKQKKEKVAVALSGQSPWREENPLVGNSTISSESQPSPKIAELILT